MSTAEVEQKDIAEVDEKKPICENGFDPNIKYPIVVRYCGECSMPLEYCEYSGITERCRKWLEKNEVSGLDKLEINDNDDGEDADAQKKHQKRGGKGLKPTGEKTISTKKKTNTPSKVTLQRAPRGKNKSMTVIKGLGTFDVDLKAAAKFFAGRFACGSSVTGADEIVIQGDVKDDLFNLITEKWPIIGEGSIEDLGDQKR
ncbi:unnamed protein product [Anisakis simplex]|uniref:Density-regulated protein n=1 Tax=Anisakis simplex TaxID=6269 RepID=A0A0M3K2H4_ANISI|nr:unnamed protein product [Anisakis simplex]